MKKFLLITITLIGSYSLHGAGGDPGLDAAIAASLAENAELQRAIQLSLGHVDEPVHHHHGHGHAAAHVPPPVVPHDHGPVAAKAPPPPAGKGDEIITEDCLFCGEESVQVFAPCANCKTIYSCQDCLSGAMGSEECTICHTKGTFKPIPAAFKGQADADLPFAQMLELEKKIQLERVNIIEEAITSARGFLTDMARNSGDPVPTEEALNQATQDQRANLEHWRNLMHTLAMYRHHSQGNAHGATTTLAEITPDRQEHAQKIAKNEDLIAILLEMLEEALAFQEGHPYEPIPKFEDLVE